MLGGYQSEINSNCVLWMCIKVVNSGVSGLDKAKP
jgi:hypothetical protein